MEHIKTRATAIVLRPHVCTRVGFSSTTLWRETRAGRFPQPVKISPGRIGWLESDLEAWFAEKAGKAVAAQAKTNV